MFGSVYCTPYGTVYCGSGAALRMAKYSITSILVTLRRFHTFLATLDPVILDVIAVNAVPIFFS